VKKGVKKMKMEGIDLSILKRIPQLSQKVKLKIEPLAPLSMVNDLPGSFYKSLKSPSKKMLCGLFENMLGWHIDIADRMAIQKDLIKLRKKQKIEYIKPQQGSTYVPLIMEYFDIELVTLPPMMHYNDLWSKSYRRADADVHPKGTINLSYELIPIKREQKRNDKKPKQISNDELLNLFKKNIDKYPTYYSTPTSREYIQINSPIEIIMILDSAIFNQINESAKMNNCLYLGNSEGWINLKIETYE
jgi:CRISPR-associated protein Cas5